MTILFSDIKDFTSISESMALSSHTVLVLLVSPTPDLPFLCLRGPFERFPLTLTVLNRDC